MIKTLKSWLSQVTMYRLMLYYLLAIIAYAIVSSFLGVLPYAGWNILAVTLYLCFVSWLTNQLLARLWHVSPNFESQFITALILSLIIGPFPVGSNLLFLTIAAVVAMASKYLLVWQRRHIFNPAAFGVVVTAILFGQGASWWVGTPLLAPVVLIGSLPIAYKLRRSELVLSFLAASLALLGITLFVSRADSLVIPIMNFIFSTPLLFFAFVMLVEPLTSPSTVRERIYYGLFVAGVWWLYQTRLPGIFYSLELALLTGNIFARILQHDPRVTLRLKEKQEIALNTWHYKFESEQHFSFLAGQYMEWSLPHAHPDSRGTRRYFTIASSPTKPTVDLITKIIPQPSSFKQALKKLKPGDQLCAAQISGEFTLPKNKKQPLVFIAGGIGVTPFISMVQYLLDTNQAHPITLLYSNRSPADMIGQELFNKAKDTFGLKTVYTVTEDIPDSWEGKTGYIDEAMIKESVPNYQKAIFYISGPEPMVEAFIKLLGGMNISRFQIKRDFFPGYTETHQKEKS